MTTIRILADDLTGALDTAAAFAGEVPVWIDRPGDHVGDDDVAVSVVATGTRDVARSELEPLLAPNVAWLRAADVLVQEGRQSSARQYLRRVRAVGS